MEANKKVTVWITTHALTQGILKVKNATIQTVDKRSFVSWGDGAFTSFAHGHDWHRTEEDAIKRARQMRDKKIDSLNVQLKKLFKMEFGDEGD